MSDDTKAPSDLTPDAVVDTWAGYASEDPDNMTPGEALAARLARQLKACRVALRYYADPDVYVTRESRGTAPDGSVEMAVPVLDDDGARARAQLPEGGE